MAVLIDPPMWPAHGTLFSHMVSDTSLQELHAFAAAADIPEGAFDADHYDVPQHRYLDLVALGAQEVSAAELVRRLIAAGLRIPAHQRPSHQRKVLGQRFSKLFPHQPSLAYESSLQDLLLRWAEPHRSYHNLNHLLAMLNAVDLLERRGESLGRSPKAVRLAVWFHDAIYTGQTPAGVDEENSALLAENVLSTLPVTDSDIEETARLIRLTAHHSPASDDEAGAVISDADLEVLGRPIAQYNRYVSEIRNEYSHVPEPEFLTGRAAVLRALLELEPLYNTRTAYQLWEEPARFNLAGELDGQP